MERRKRMRPISGWPRSCWVQLKVRYRSESTKGQDTVSNLRLVVPNLSVPQHSIDHMAFYSSCNVRIENKVTYGVGSEEGNMYVVIE